MYRRKTQMQRQIDMYVKVRTVTYDHSYDFMNNETLIIQKIKINLRVQRGNDHSLFTDHLMENVNPNVYLFTIFIRLNGRNFLKKSR